MKYIFTLLILATLILTSCNNDEKIMLSDKINTKLQQIIQTKNDSLIQTMMTSNLKIYKTLGTDDFNKNIQSRTRNVSWAFRKQYTNGSYKIYDQYHIIDGIKTRRSELTSDDKATLLNGQTHLRKLKYRC